MAQFKDKDEFLDGLYDHIFGDGEVTDEDETWFEHVEKFFDEKEENSSGNSSGDSGGQTSDDKKTSRRRQRRQTTNPPRRRRTQGTTGTTGYGNSRWFGS